MSGHTAGAILRAAVMGGARPGPGTVRGWRAGRAPAAPRPRAGQRAMPDCYTYPSRTDALTQDSGLRTQHSGLVGMLLELTIRDFAIIDRLRLDFGPGFNALTGETGAGKSIIVDALGAILGERTGPELVRAGAPGARVEGVFALDPAGHPGSAAEVRALLAEFGLDDEAASDGDEPLILTREIAAGGRSTARVNGRAVTAAILSRL